MAEKVYATGRRKTGVARVFLTPSGSGKFVVNGKSAEEYMPEFFREVMFTPFKVTDTLGKFDVYCTVKGSGLRGQAESIRHGIARALDKVDSETYHKTLKLAGFLTRDSRMVERKKAGLRKARKKEQYSKR